MRKALLVLLLASVDVAAQAVEPRWVEASQELVAAERAARAGQADDAVERIMKVLDDPESIDVFVGNPRTMGSVRGLRAAARDRAVALAGELPAFRESWEEEAETRLTRVRPERERAGLERVASVFRGTAAAGRALRRLAVLAWDSGEPGRAADLLERSGLELTPAEGARLAAGRRASGRGPSAGEWARRWQASHAAGLRPNFPRCGFPPLHSPLLIRGVRTSLGAFLDTLRVAPRTPWRGEVNATDAPFPPLRSLSRTPQRVLLFDQIPANANPAGGSGVIFNDLGAYEGASPVRLLPVGKRVVASARKGLSILEQGADGAWRVAGGAKGAPPLGSQGLSSDGRRLFALVPDPSGAAGTVRLVPAAFTLEGNALRSAWVSRTEGEEGPFGDAWGAGAPTLADGRLFVPVALVDSAFVTGIECLDAATGDRLWATTLGEATRQTFSATSRTASSPPTVCGERVLLSTGQGIVVALDAATGDPEWLHAYSTDPGARTFADTPPRAAGGRALFSPLDARSEILLDLATGRPLLSPWPAALPAFRYAVSDGPRAILCGSDGALQGEGGPRGIVKVLNSAAPGDVLFELPDPPAGRPAAWEGMLYVPTVRGLYAMDLETGVLSVIRDWAADEAGDIVRLPGWVAVVKTGEIRFWEASDR